ncbi:MAG: WhiB family transcriptional regulator [Acidimicrobiales bacterium]
MLPVTKAARRARPVAAHRLRYVRGADGAAIPPVRGALRDLRRASKGVRSGIGEPDNSGHSIFGRLVIFGDRLAAVRVPRSGSGERGETRHRQVLPHRRRQGAGGVARSRARRHASRPRRNASVRGGVSPDVPRSCARQEVGPTPDGPRMPLKPLASAMVRSVRRIPAVNGSSGPPCHGITPETFSGRVSTRRREALGVCAGCPVRQECLLDALALPDGATSVPAPGRRNGDRCAGSDRRPTIDVARTSTIRWRRGRLRRQRVLLAEVAGADVLVSGDPDLTTVQRPELVVMTPRSLLESLDDA